jgi:putative SOS response-associated peptidase YedK
LSPSSFVICNTPVEVQFTSAGCLNYPCRTSREAFKQTRCIIPASGYYEWQDTPGGKQPHYFTRTDGQVISFAGLWDEWKDRASGETVKSCTMIITEPNAMVAEVHDRMPVVLEPDNFTPWLEREVGLEILLPAAEGILQRWPVSKRVNSSKAPKDDETLTQPVDIDAPQLQV